MEWNVLILTASYIRIPYFSCVYPDIWLILFPKFQFYLYCCDKMQTINPEMLSNKEGSRVCVRCVGEVIHEADGDGELE